jgi:polyisoprenoid-binding protein YceI
MLRSFAALAVAVFTASFAAADEKYTLNGENTQVTFTGKKPDGKHDGGFKKLTGAITEAGGAWKLEVEIDTDSLYSDNDGLTKHLKNADFFSVKEFPNAKFASTKIEKAEKEGEVKITGNLTLLGKTKEISFTGKVTHGDTLKLVSEFAIDRNDFGMSYGKGKIEDAVAIKVNVEAKK